MLPTFKRNSLTKHSRHCRAGDKNHCRHHCCDYHLVQDIQHRAACSRGQYTSIIRRNPAQRWSASGYIPYDPTPGSELTYFIGSIYFVLVVGMLIYLITKSNLLLPRLLTTINILNIVFYFTMVSYPSRLSNELHGRRVLTICIFIFKTFTGF